MTTTDLNALRKAMGGLLESGSVRTLIGWEHGSNAFRSRPAFFRTPNEVDGALFSPACTPSLVRMIIEDIHYPLDGPDNRAPLGIVIRGCDDRGIIELIKDRRICREDVVIIGVDCPGVVDWRKVKSLVKDEELTLDDITQGELKWKGGSIVLLTSDGEKALEPNRVLMNKCLACEGHSPRIFDTMIGDEDRNRKTAPDPKEVTDIDGESSDDKWKFWEDVFSRCVRCYACRNICTYCYCEECAIDPTRLAVTAKTSAAEKANRPQWTGRDNTVPSNGVYLTMRAYHGSGRCTSCEECDRACPMGLPLRLLNRKVRRDARELFNYEAGDKPDDKPLLGDACDTDPGGFIW